MGPRRIFVAVGQRACPRIARALSGYELLEASTLCQAPNLLREPDIDLFVIGIHFDDSRAIELIRLIRLNPELIEVPILVTRTSPTEQAVLLRDTLGSMKAIMAISDYLELEEDDEETFIAELRLAVESALSLRAAKKGKCKL